MTESDRQDENQEQDSAQQAKVEPIRRLRDIKAIKSLLKDNPRNSALFTLGINTNLMPTELLHIKVQQVRHLDFHEEIEIADEKTGKSRKIPINRISVLAIRALLESDHYADDDFLFKSQRGNLIVPSLHRLVTKWCEAIGLEGNFGSHTLRETWGYLQHHSFGVEVSRLTKAFNHSTQKQTREYLCLEDPEEIDLFHNEI